jgi:SpoIID/LytB domain protein
VNARLRSFVALPGLLATITATATVGIGIAVVTETNAAAPAAAYPADRVALAGHGFGHGRGMGQYGSLGYAIDHGWDYKRILAHYYGGTHEGSLEGGDGGYLMKVRIMDRNGTDTIVTAAQGGFVTIDGDPTPRNAILVRRVGVNQWQVYAGNTCSGEPWTQLGDRSGVEDLRISSTNGLQTICLSNGTRTVRGTVRAAQIDNAQATVNDVAMGDYLKGVIPRESPASWGNLDGSDGTPRAGMHALRAQAVAARSYAASETRYGVVAKTCDTTSCQVYAGMSQTVNGSTVGESANTNQAVDETAGQIRRHDGSGNVARTEFSSSTGGWSAGGVFPVVHDDGDDTASNPNHNWTTTIPVANIEAKYAGRGELLRVDVLQRNGIGADGGRVVKMQLVFSQGAVELSGDDFRIAFGLKSNWFTVTNQPSFPYHVVTRDGGVFSFGGAQFHGSLPGIGVRTPAKDITEGPVGHGYWILGEDGGVFSFDVPFYGSMGGQRLNRPVAGMEATATRQGYWLVAGDGGIFSFGDAPFFGSTGDMRLNQPVVGMAPTPTGNGYWLVATDGGIFTFGDAAFKGSTGNIRLNQPVFAMAPTPTGNGYWLVARDGGIFTFGDATFQGSLPGKKVRETAIELLPSPSGFGYLIVTAEGRVHAFGDAASAGGPRDVGAGPSPAVGAGRVPT